MSAGPGTPTASAVTSGYSGVSPIQDDRMLVVGRGAVYTFSQTVAICPGTTKLDLEAFFHTITTAPGACNINLCFGTATCSATASSSWKVTYDEDWRGVARSWAVTPSTATSVVVQVAVTCTGSGYAAAGYLDAVSIQG